MLHTLRHHAVIFLVLVLTGLVGACQSTATPQPAQQPAAEQKPAEQSAPQERPLKIAYVQTGPFDYYEYGVQGAKLAAKELGVELIVLNSDLKPEKEIANVEDAIQQGVDGIILFSVGRASEEAALEKTSEANIPVALLYGYDPSLEDKGVVFVNVNINETGKQLGEWVAENVEKGRVAIIQGQLGRGDAEAYTQGFKDALAKNSNLTVVAEIDAAWDRSKAVAAMEDILTRHPDLAVAFVHNEDMAQGAVSVLKTQGKLDQVTVVSQNGSPSGLEVIAAGEIKATAAWSPSEEAQMALQRLVTAIRTGQTPEPKLCFTPLKLITQTNVDEASPWVPTEASTKVALAAECGQ